ncbi:unnamed protein product, partial [Heterotrigona itama]
FQLKGKANRNSNFKFNLNSKLNVDEKRTYAQCFDTSYLELNVEISASDAQESEEKS